MARAPGARRASGTGSGGYAHAGTSGTDRCRDAATRAPRRGHARARCARTRRTSHGTPTVCSTHRSTRSPPGSSATRATRHGACSPRIVSKSVVSCTLRFYVTARHARQAPHPARGLHDGPNYSWISLKDHFFDARRQTLMCLPLNLCRQPRDYGLVSNQYLSPEEFILRRGLHEVLRNARAV